MNGTAAAQETGKTDAVGTADADPTIAETEFIINQYAGKAVIFDKVWVGENHTATLNDRPTHTVTRPAAEEGADPIVTVEDVPITVRIQRRLQYVLSSFRGRKRPRKAPESS